MKTIIFLIGLFFWMISTSFASPFIACEPYPPAEIQPQYFYVSLDGANPIKVTHVVTDLGWKLLDVGNVLMGQHNITVKACIAETSDWSEACSAEVPFAFTRPASTLNPPYLKLLK